MTEGVLNVISAVLTRRKSTQLSISGVIILNSEYRARRNAGLANGRYFSGMRRREAKRRRLLLSPRANNNQITSLLRMMQMVKYQYGK